MKILLLLLFIIFLNNGLFAQKNPCNCKETTKIEKQHRTKAKHITNYENYPKAKYEITTEDIIKWENMYSTFTRDIKKETERVHETPEDSLYVLKGYMYFVKQEANDCDFHIEIGPKNIKSKRRIIVEVTKENCELQQKILKQIKLKGFKMKKQFTKGIPCTIVGIGFYDAAHKPKHHGGIYTHKTSWELHPVKSIKFENE